MTVKDIADFVAGIDPEARHYVTAKDGTDFTVWMEYEAMGLAADDNVPVEGWRFELARFTKQEFDHVAQVFHKAMLDNPHIALRSYRVEYTPQTGYIEHRFDCEAV